MQKVADREFELAINSGQIPGVALMAKDKSGEHVIAGAQLERLVDGD